MKKVSKDPRDFLNVAKSTFFDGTSLIDLEGVGLGSQSGHSVACISVGHFHYDLLGPFV